MTNSAIVLLAILVAAFMGLQFRRALERPPQWRWTGWGKSTRYDLSRREFLAFTAFEIVLCLGFAVFVAIGGVQ